MNLTLLSSFYSSGSRASRDGGRALPTIDPEQGLFMKPFTAQEALIKALYLSCVLLLCPAVSVAQVVNGSFEVDGQSSLSGWRFTCAGMSFEDAPSGGGTWSLKLAPGNLQDCFLGQTFQTIPVVQNGEVWRLTAWVKQDPIAPSVASIYWKISSSADTSIPLSSDTTTARIWTRLSVVDTLYLATGDSAMIVLDAGATSGPSVLESGSSFDLVSVERLDATPVRYEEGPEPGLDGFNLSQNFPNPFDGATTIPFHLGRPGNARLDVYDVLGRKVETLLAGYLPGGAHQAAWHATGLPPGMYFGRLQADQEVRVLKMTLLR